MAYGDWFEPRNEREEDLRRVYLARAKESHKRGHMGCHALTADEHRDTFVVIAEYRTMKVAARLTYDAVEGEYELELHYRADWNPRRFRLSPVNAAQAQGWLDRVVQRHPLVPFRCAVDM